jgi:hypothetical protein
MIITTLPLEHVDINCIKIKHVKRDRLNRAVNREELLQLNYDRAIATIDHQKHQAKEMILLIRQLKDNNELLQKANTESKDS